MEDTPVNSDISLQGADQSGRTERIFAMTNHSTLSPTSAATSRAPAAPTHPARPARKAAAANPVPLTRAASAWIAICVAGLIAVGLIVFLAQNTATVPITFLWMHVQASLTVSLLIAAVGGILLTAVLGMTRIIQLRRLIRHGKPRLTPEPLAHVRETS
jgi:lipopolysaccharide assembly protein A